MYNISSYFWIAIFPTNESMEELSRSKLQKL